MLSYYLEWNLRQKLAPILFDDHEREAAESGRASIVARAPRSQAALQKDKTRQTASGLPVHSFRTLLADWATMAKNRVRLPGSQPEFDVLTQPTPLQKQVFDLLNLQPQL
jgi:hypothetical protein